MDDTHKQTEYTVLFPFAGIGAGALGFLQARAKLCGHDARFRSLGGIDVDAEACQDFESLTGSPALQADVHDLTPEQLRAFCPECPDVIFQSPPCKASSRLTSNAAAKTARYQKMQRLVLDWLRLQFETWTDRPKLVLIENVPGITSPTRGKAVLDEAKRLLTAEGYVFDEGYHECGELGGLAQLRKRYLLVARRPKQCPPLLYQPPKLRVRGCGEVVGLLPLPNADEGGPLHTMSKLSWLNWIRLALIPAGGDWRDLPGVLEKGQQRRAVFQRYRIEHWEHPTFSVDGPGTNGTFGVADPRVRSARNGAYGVRGWEQPSRTVTGSANVDNGPFSVADPRIKTGFDHSYRVLRWTEPSFTVAGKAHPGCGAYTVADPRTDAACTLYGEDGTPVVVEDLKVRPKRVPVLISEDGTWHRPFTPLELAVLQGLPATVNDKPLTLAGRRRDGWCERIGNAVPVGAAKAIATQMLVTLTHAAVESFALASTPVWVDRDAPSLHHEHGASMH
jgi:site-specific DNA-cytosine methylase